MIAVTELKQWAYCPRVVFYHQCMPGAGVMTHKMREAMRAQEWLENLELRRSLNKYGFASAQRQFGVWLSDPTLGLSGRIDLLLATESAATVVDFKLTSGSPGENHRMQFAGYALLVQARLNLNITTAFLYRIPDSQVFEIPITPDLLEKARTALADIQSLADTQVLPPPTPVRARCTDCEYTNFCGDIW